MTVTDEKGELNIRDLAKFYGTELLERCVPFWEKYSPDADFGGYITHLKRACQVMKWSMELGWDPVFGGIYNYIDILETAAGHHDEEWGEDQDWDEKIFWIHAEALYALLLGYITTGDKELLSWYTKVHYWTFKYFPDREYGEWFGYLRRDGTVSQTIKGAMKGFFHIPRALLNCMLLLESEIR